MTEKAEIMNELILRRTVMEEKTLEICKEKIMYCLMHAEDEKELVEMIKEELEKNCGGFGWNVVLGKDFGSHIFHKSKYFANFNIGELELVIWRC
jgi:dynein light chain LC8-type